MTHVYFNEKFVERLLLKDTTRSSIIGQCPNLGPRISRWEINKFENCWYKSVRIFEALKLLFQQFLNLSSSQRDISGPILGTLSNNRWSGGTVWKTWEQLFQLWESDRSNICKWSTSNMCNEGGGNLRPSALNSSEHRSPGPMLWLPPPTPRTSELRQQSRWEVSTHSPPEKKTRWWKDKERKEHVNTLP